MFSRFEMSLTKLGITSRTVPVSLYLVFGLLGPMLFLYFMHSGEKEVPLSDAAALGWALFTQLTVCGLTFPELQRKRLWLMGAMLALCVCYVVFVEVTEDPSMPPEPVLNDLTKTLGCALYDPDNTFPNVGCKELEYYYKLEPILDADLLVNSSNLVGPTIYSRNAIHAAVAGRMLHHFFELMGSVMFVTFPANESLRDRDQPCRDAMRRYACGATFQPCTGDCEQQLRPCQSMCESVLKECPGIEKLYDLIAPGTEIRGVVFAAEDEIAPLTRFFDRLFLSLKMRCPVHRPNTTIDITTPPMCVDSSTFKPDDEGTCNFNTRSVLKRDNDARTAIYETELRARDDDVQQMFDVRRALPFVMFVLYGIALLIIAKFLGDIRSQLAESADFWVRWWEVTPKLTHLATPLQLSVIVLLLLMAAYVERNTSYWYVSVVENLVSVALLNFTIETVICYVRLEDECNPESALKRPQRHIPILYEVSVYGKYFAVKVCAQEAFEVAIQFTYFFVAIDTTDEATIIVQATVLFVNLVVTPYLMTTYRSSVVLFDAVVEAIYFIINVVNALTRDEQTQSIGLASVLIEMTSLCFSSWGCVSSLYVLSQYYFHYKYTGMVMMAVSDTTAAGEEGGGKRIIVRGVDETETGDAPDSTRQEMMEMPEWVAIGAGNGPTTDGRDQETVADDDTGSTSRCASPPGLSAANVRLQAVMQHTKSATNSALIPVSRNTRIAVCFVCVCLAVVFYVSTMARLGLQDNQCREMVGDTLWSKVSPKLVFPDGFAADTRCELSVASSIDLSDQGITEVPPGIVHFTSLHSLDLSNNHLTTIPSLLSRIPLEFLFLANNNITWIDPDVFETPPLKHVDVSGNPFAKYVNWSHSNLSKIPRHLPLLNTTDVLLLNNNDIQDISVLQNISVVEHLDMSYNNISAIPPAYLGQADTNLVNFSHNFLVAKGSLSSGSMAQGISTLLCAVLDFTYNKFDVLPTLIVYATTVPAERPTILISHNNITEVNMRDLGSISLSLDMPFLEDIKDEIVSFDGSNQWNVIGAPVSLAHSTSLRYFNISDAAWGNDPSNTECRAFRYNEWWYLVNSFRHMEILDLSYDPVFHRLCLLPTLDVALDLPSLKRFWMRGQSSRGLFHCERCFMDTFAALEELDISGYNRTVAEPANITDDEIMASVPFPQVARFRSTLQRLYVDRAEFGKTNFVAVIGVLAQLRYLSFDDSDVSEFPASLVTTSLPNLRVLMMSNNLLASVPLAALSSHPALETYDISGNLLGTAIDAALLFGAPNLKCVFVGPQAHRRMLPVVNYANPSWATRLSVVDLRGVVARPLLAATSCFKSGANWCTQMRRVCVDAGDLSMCKTAFGDGVGGNSSVCTTEDVCGRGSAAADHCGVDHHYYSKLTFTVSSVENRCNDCSGKCTKKFVLGDGIMPSLPPPKECKNVVIFNSDRWG
eukprot:PhM_4_TR15954/c2_g1_i1/m.102849